MVPAVPAPGPAAPEPPLPWWSPFRSRLYRVIWIALLASTIGMWMQTVTAQWLMASLSGEPLMVALVQTAMTLPFLLLSLPAGAIGDVVDRRRLVLATQAVLVAAAALLTALTFADRMTAWLLLGLTFLLGLAQAVSAPAWLAVPLELVGRKELPHAAALGGANLNVSRAVGPALGGALVGATGAGWVFAMTTATFMLLLVVVMFWRRPAPARPVPAEPLGTAMRAGLRYARRAPLLRRVLAHTGTFVILGSGMWALLPVVARDHLSLDATGFGLLLAAVGAGAIVAAWQHAALRSRVSLDNLVRGATVAFALVCLVLAWTRSAAVAGVALVVGGMAWTVVNSGLNGSAQMALANWVRSRGMALYLLVLIGSQAIGGLLWGLLAQYTSTATALGAMAATLTASLALTQRWKLEVLDRARSLQ
jgi:MFS family permease